MAEIFNTSTGAINMCWYLVKYNANEVQEAIDRNKTISKKQAKLIHAFLMCNSCKVSVNRSLLCQKGRV
jgi:hypothetical protein